MKNTVFPEAKLNETESGFGLEYLIPGVNKENLDIELHNNILQITANPEVETGDRNLVSRKSFDKEYRHSIRLGGNIDQDKITATATDGVVTLALPKKPEREPKKIELA